MPTRFSVSARFSIASLLFLFAGADLGLTQPVHAQSWDASGFLPQARPLTGAMRRIIGQDSAQTWQSAAAHNSVPGGHPTTVYSSADTPGTLTQDTARGRIAARNQAAINAAILRARAGGAACN